MKKQKTITIHGSTGSIGINTLDVIARHADIYSVFALTAKNKVDQLFEQCRKFSPVFAVIADKNLQKYLTDKLTDAGLDTKVLSGASGLEIISKHEDVDIVVTAIVGAAGLLPTLAAVDAGKKILIANKEPLVMCGDLILERARASRAVILPVDSEHNAIFQCMPRDYNSGNIPPGVSKILLTGSGGPFRNYTKEKMKFVTPEQACNHPNWSMGPKISVDSATMMNKGLELIEACHLFGTAHEKIEIVVHPQSIVHSMVEYEDGSVLAQLGNPDMRTPIAHALAWPDRISSGVDKLDFFNMKDFHFEKPDTEKFPSINIARAAASVMGTAPTIMNAANEQAVGAFLKGRINFNKITETIDYVMSKQASTNADTLDAILEADNLARHTADSFLDGQTVQVG
jgi:1-deoxy-D-xylulose-5-phosphate reductoisomerase